MASYPLVPLGSRFTGALETLNEGEGLSFAQALSEQEVQQAADVEGLEFGADADCVYRPATLESAW